VSGFSPRGRKIIAAHRYLASLGYPMPSTFNDSPIDDFGHLMKTGER
jgi:hypothetical protein